VRACRTLLLGLVLGVWALGAARAAEPPATPQARLQGPLLVVRWTPVAGAAAYRLDRQVGEGPWQLLTRPQLADTLYTDTALAPGQPHRYRVTALDAAGQDSPPSAEATVDVPIGAAPEGHRY
jgi:exo-1,4-beta-D-glucosaminidase